MSRLCRAGGAESRPTWVAVSDLTACAFARYGATSAACRAEIATTRSHESILDEPESFVVDEVCACSELLVEEREKIARWSAQACVRRAMTVTKESRAFEVLLCALRAF
jgi:hypothetical protein